MFRYDGSGPVVKKEVEVLWDAVWQPAAQGVYPDRPASPGRKGPTAADAAAGEQNKQRVESTILLFAEVFFGLCVCNTFWSDGRKHLFFLPRCFVLNSAREV